MRAILRSDSLLRKKALPAIMSSPCPPVRGPASCISEATISRAFEKAPACLRPSSPPGPATVRRPSNAGKGATEPPAAPSSNVCET